MSPLSDPENVAWVVEIPPPAIAPEDAETASGEPEGSEEPMPDFILAEHTEGMSFVSRMPADLKAYWLSGPGAAKVGWGTPGSFRRCVSNLREHFPQNPEGLCANLYHEATSHWPGENRDK
jgi:hypothetical protein